MVELTGEMVRLHTGGGTAPGVMVTYANAEHPLESVALMMTTTVSVVVEGSASILALKNPAPPPSGEIVTWSPFCTAVQVTLPVKLEA